jgi:two-component sensor histidine kinase
VKGKLVRDQSGEPSKWPGASVDITELKRAQERQRLLPEELGHRVKNTLAIVQAISAQTLRNAETLGDAQKARRYTPAGKE